MKAAFLFYKKFIGDLTSIILKLRFYYPCVANNLINFKQMAVVWYAGGIKISHKSKKIFNRMVKCLKKTYERLFCGCMK